MSSRAAQGPLPDRAQRAPMCVRSLGPGPGRLRLPVTGEITADIPRGILAEIRALALILACACRGDASCLREGGDGP